MTSCCFWQNNDKKRAGKPDAVKGYITVERSCSFYVFDSCGKRAKARLARLLLMRRRPHIPPLAAGKGWYALFWGGLPEQNRNGQCCIQRRSYPRATGRTNARVRYPAVYEVSMLLTAGYLIPDKARVQLPGSAIRDTPT